MSDAAPSIQFTGAKVTLLDPGARAWDLQFSSDGSLLFARIEGRSRTEEVFDATDLRSLGSLEAFAATCPADDGADGPFFVGSGEEEEIILNLRTLCVLTESTVPIVALEEDEFRIVAMDTRRRHIAVTGAFDESQHELFLRPLDGGPARSCDTIPGYGMHPVFAEFNPQGDRLIVITYSDLLDRHFQVKKEDGQPLRSRWSSVLQLRTFYHATFGDDGNTLFAVGNRGLSRWNASTGAFLGEWDCGVASAVARTGADDVLVATKRQPALWSWNIEHELAVKLIDLQLGEDATVTSLACSGRRVALGTSNGEILLAERQ